ncbi:MAG TPA: peptidylprolyl isomerase [Candidatus Omnitrophota bacterium]|nr:peptidylprolyl isomerase [Candidatus Omnitrophota bacterium]HPS19921.1 peptidylprolyl isomerase [Candidatus Omnitrophota bacterium]
MGRMGKILIAAMVSTMMSIGPAMAEVVDKVIVVVNDETITQREFDRAFTQIQKSYEANFKGDELARRLEEAKKALMDQMINTKLAMSLAKKAGIKVDEKELQNRIDMIKSYYPSEPEFLKALSDRGTNLTEFRKEITDQMMAQQLVEKEVSSKIVIPPGEITDLYEKNKEKLIAPRRIKVAEIMVRKDQTAPAETSKAKIADIKSKIEKGADFAEIAKKESNGPYAQNGGEMGFVAQGQLLPEMDSVIFKTEKGKITDVIETQMGYHIFKIEEIEESRPLKLEEVSDFLKGQLFRKKFEENLMKWLEEKRKNAYIAYK